MEIMSGRQIFISLTIILSKRLLQFDVKKKDPNKTNKKPTNKQRQQQPNSLKNAFQSNINFK